jgi:glutathione S-transferase
MATHITLNEIGVPFTAKPISFARNEQRDPAYLAINPEGKVPALVIDGRVLTEVAATLYYLARAYPQARLFPDEDIEAQAQVIAWMSFIASSIHRARTRNLNEFLAIWERTEKRFEAREWAVGDRYSIADIHLFRLFWRFLGTDVERARGLPNLYRHYERMMARLAVQKTIATEAAVGYEFRN